MTFVKLSYFKKTISCWIPIRRFLRADEWNERTYSVCLLLGTFTMMTDDSDTTVHCPKRPRRKINGSTSNHYWICRALKSLRNFCSSPIFSRLLIRFSSPSRLILAEIERCSSSKFLSGTDRLRILQFVLVFTANRTAADSTLPLVGFFFNSVTKTSFSKSGVDDDEQVDVFLLKRKRSNSSDEEKTRLHLARKGIEVRRK